MVGIVTVQIGAGRGKKGFGQEISEPDQYPPDGGFIWLYDSVVNCLLSGCCGGTEKAPVPTAKAYREAITNELS